jgi:peptidoglycan/LPS O-acetylase OafA/YrhL
MGKGSPLPTVAAASVTPVLAMIILLVVLELVTQEVACNDAAQGTEKTMAGLVPHEVAGGASRQSRSKTTLALWSIGVEGGVGIVWRLVLGVVRVVRRLLLLAVAWLLRVLAWVGAVAASILALFATRMVVSWRQCEE